MPKSNSWELELHSRLCFSPTLIFAGLVKNAGKTTALNAVNALFPDECLGLTTIGYDGEALDSIYRRPKPPVLIQAGQLILTAQRFLPQSPPAYNILDAWGSHPQYGSWLILKTTAPGNFQMAGPSTLTELMAGISRLKDHGATRIHVDGAFNRLSHISLKSADNTQTREATGIVLSTGAALGNTLKEITQRTQHIIELFQLPADVQLSGIPDGNAYLLENTWFPLPSFLWNQDLKSLLPHFVDTIQLKGAFTDSFYLGLRAAGRLPRQFIVQTPAHILLSSSIWCGLKSRGIDVKLRTRPHLAMITLNPWHPITPIATPQIAQALLPYAAVPLVDVQRQQVWLPAPNCSEINHPEC